MYSENIYIHIYKSVAKSKKTLDMFVEGNYSVDGVDVHTVHTTDGAFLRFYE
jgi:hypothetical protein